MVDLGKITLWVQKRINFSKIKKGERSGISILHLGTTIFKVRKGCMFYWTGCSGWQYPEWKGVFYPNELAKSQWFQFYCEQFHTVEINYSFYRFPSAKTMEKWKELVSPGFRYSLKANKSITHYHRFNQTEELIKDFYQLSDILGDKLGCILFQLPKRLKYDMEFLKKIVNQLSKDKINVLEFQDESWWNNRAIEFLNKRHIVFANINSPIIHKPFHPTGERCYLRLHGRDLWYQGLYGKAYLQNWFEAIKKSPCKELWVYFDNTMDGSAVKDAKIWESLYN